MQRSFLRLLVLAGIFLVPIRSDADITSNLAAWYKLDEASGTTASDSAGSFTGTTHGSSTWGTGKIGGCASFASASSQYIGCGTPLNTTYSAFTISFWAYRSSGTNGVYVGAMPGTTNYDGVQLATDGYCYFLAGQAIQYRRVSYASTGWHHYALVYDGTQGTADNRITPYIDGAAATVFSTNGTIASSINVTGNFEIGRVAASNSYSDGSVDDVRVYTRALSAADVSILYLYGRSVSRSRIVNSGAAAGSVSRGGVVNAN